MTLTPNQVHEVLQKHMLVDGYDLVCDLTKSHGSWLHDAKSGKTFLDMFSFFASLPLGFNHPKLLEPSFLQKLTMTAINKVANSDVYTIEFAEAVQSFSRFAIPPELPYLFFIDGGALAVENALKAAFDWKVKKNFGKRKKKELGYRVIHFRHAFHGRSGYTLSLTNTADPRKYQYFPKFKWPRINPPMLSFPVTKEVTKSVQAAEEKALKQIKAIIKKSGADIAAIIIEPIQAEGGDNHFRQEFLKSLRKLCDHNDILLIFDEVQTGFGVTGKMWAFQHCGVVPDLLAFGKKAQVGGVLCGRRIDEVKNNVFKEPSRINSTFGGNLVDLVRVGRILEIMHEDNILQHVTQTGKHLLKSLEQLAQEKKNVTNIRGAGLLCALDLSSTEERNRVQEKCYELGMIILPCGTHSLRFRPSLTISTEEIDRAVETLREAIV